MSDSDAMDVNSGDDPEVDFLQEVTQFHDSLGESIDSLQGSVKLPTFSMNQYVGTELQSSQGFHVHGSSCLTADQQNAVNSESVVTGQFTSGSEFVNTGFSSVAASVSCGMNLPGNTLIFSHSQIGSLNLVTSTNQFQVLNMPGSQQEATQGLLMASDSKCDVREGSVFSEVFEGGSSDEKSGKCKTSPKRRARKSRSSSSTGNEMSSRPEVNGPSPNRLEGLDAQSSGEMGFKPSLLDEILTEKKMALMKSPQVVQFLQTQQRKLAHEKKMMCGQHADS